MIISITRDHHILHHQPNHHYEQLTSGFPIHPDAFNAALPLPRHRHRWHVRHCTGQNDQPRDDDDHHDDTGCHVKHDDQSDDRNDDKDDDRDYYKSRWSSLRVVCLFDADHCLDDQMILTDLLLITNTHYDIVLRQISSAS